MKTKSGVLKEFQQIPGVGKTIAQDLWDLGLRSLEKDGVWIAKILL